MLRVVVGGGPGGRVRGRGGRGRGAPALVAAGAGAAARRSVAGVRRLAGGSAPALVSVERSQVRFVAVKVDSAACRVPRFSININDSSFLYRCTAVGQK